VRGRHPKLAPAAAAAPDPGAFVSIRAAGGGPGGAAIRGRLAPWTVGMRPPSASLGPGAAGVGRLVAAVGVPPAPPGRFLAACAPGLAPDTAAGLRRWAREGRAPRLARA
jgi:hypothetical protein